MTAGPIEQSGTELVGSQRYVAAGSPRLAPENLQSALEQSLLKRSARLTLALPAAEAFCSRV